MDERVTIEIERIVQRMKITVERIGPKPTPSSPKRIPVTTIDITPRPVLRIVSAA